MRTIYEENCKLHCTDKDQIVEAVVMQYTPKDYLTVVLATNKIHMKWNGKLFVGNAAGLEFTTPGPNEINVKEGRY
jgi:hypothetical protein